MILRKTREMDFLYRPWAELSVGSSRVCTLASLDCPLRCGPPGGKEPPRREGINLEGGLLRTMTLEAQGPPGP